jgi:hypothetical protein
MQVRVTGSQVVSGPQGSWLEQGLPEEARGSTEHAHAQTTTGIRSSVGIAFMLVPDGTYLGFYLLQPGFAN